MKNTRGVVIGVIAISARRSSSWCRSPSFSSSPRDGDAGEPAAVFLADPSATG